MKPKSKQKPRKTNPQQRKRIKLRLQIKSNNSEMWKSTIKGPRKIDPRGWWSTFANVGIHHPTTPSTQIGSEHMPQRKLISEPLKNLHQEQSMTHPPLPILIVKQKITPNTQSLPKCLPKAFKKAIRNLCNRAFLHLQAYFLDPTVH